MLYASYEDLQADVQRRLNRAVFTGFPIWLREAEVWLTNGQDLMIGRSRFRSPPLRTVEMERERVFDSIPSTGIPFPDDYLDLRDIRAQFDEETREVLYQPLSTFDDIDLRDEERPVYTVRGKSMIFSSGISPPIRLWYYSKIPSLVAGNYTSHVIASVDDSPYLHGVLTAAHFQYRNLVAAGMSLALMTSAVKRLNSQAQRSRDGEAPVRAVIVGGVP